MIDDIISKIVSMEQIAIFVLLQEGVPFSRMKLFSRCAPRGSEQGISVDGKDAFTITVTFPVLSIILPVSIAIMIEGKFHAPFEYLN